MKCFCPKCRIGWSDELEKCYECGGPLEEPEPARMPVLGGPGAPLPSPVTPIAVKEARKEKGKCPTPEIPQEAPPKPKKSHKKKVKDLEVIGEESVGKISDLGL